MSENNDILSKFANYLTKIDGIHEYVLITEGFPIYWSKNMSQAQAEELSAFAIDLFNSIRNIKMKTDQQVITIEAEDTVISITQINDVIVLAKGLPGIVSVALKNLHRYVKNNLKCPWCGENLALFTYKCPTGKHILPMGIEICPFCHRKINYIRCPSCKNIVSPRGNKVTFIRPKKNILSGILFGGVSAILLGVGNMLLNVSRTGSVISFFSSVIMIVLMILSLTKKEAVELA